MIKGKTPDYSHMKTHYEANIEKNEIIEWNKDADNVTYKNLNRITELLNRKQLQIEQIIKELEFYETDRKLLVRRIKEVRDENLTLELENIKLQESCSKLKIRNKMEDTQ